MVSFTKYGALGGYTSHKYIVYVAIANDIVTPGIVIVLLTIDLWPNDNIGVDILVPT